MKNFFETVVEFQQEGEDKKTKLAYMVDAVTFAECESHITRFMIDELDQKEFLVKSMTRTAYTDVWSNPELDGCIWLETQITTEYEDGKQEKDKYLVYHLSTKTAHDLIEEKTKDWQFPKRVISIKEKPLADLIISKECCDECSLCEFTTRILSFEEQKMIDANLLTVEDINIALRRDMEELGAFEISKKKYKIKATKENLMKSIHNEISRRILKSWFEDFVDEDTGEKISIERKEVLYESGTILSKEVIDEILINGIEEISLWR